MLVLTRQRDQSIIIGDDITISVVDIRGDKVRLGIAAPRHVTVHRKEIYDEIRAQNQDSANLTPQDVAAILSPPQTPSLLKLAQRPDAFLQAAIEEAQLNQNDGNLPIAALLIRNNQIIAKGRDRRIQTNDPTAYAELDCLKNAGRQTTYQDTILYSTLTLTRLGLAAAIQFKIPRIVIADSVNLSVPHSRAGIEIIDLHDAQCIEMLASFLRAHPNPWMGDVK
jgi:cytosine/creatinine deaminase